MMEAVRPMIMSLPDRLCHSGPREARTRPEASRLRDGGAAGIICDSLMSRARLVTALVTVLLATGVAVTILWFGAVDGADFIRAHAGRLVAHRRRRRGAYNRKSGPQVASLELSRPPGRRAGADAREPAAVFRDVARDCHAVLCRRARAWSAAQRARAGRGTRRDVRLGGRACHRRDDARSSSCSSRAAGRSGPASRWRRGSRSHGPSKQSRRRLPAPSSGGPLFWRRLSAGRWPRGSFPFSDSGGRWARSISPIAFAAATDAMTAGTLVGGVAGIPLGTGITGSTTIVLLERHGVPAVVAAAAVAAFRAGTAWYSLGLGLSTLILQRRRLVAFLRPPRPTDHFSASPPATRIRSRRTSANACSTGRSR